jgi:hypothetical protein
MIVHQFHFPNPAACAGVFQFSVLCGLMNL